MQANLTNTHVIVNALMYNNNLCHNFVLWTCNQFFASPVKFDFCEFSVYFFNGWGSFFSIDRATLEYLPVYHPSQEEVADPDLYAKNVSHQMAHQLGIKVSNFSARQWMEKAAKIDSLWLLVQHHQGSYSRALNNTFEKIVNVFLHRSINWLSDDNACYDALH